MPDVELREIHPAGDEALARELLALQHAAYAVEAALIGDDRIPPLAEDLDGLRAAPLRWLGARSGGRLTGALAWSEDGGALDLERLVVDPGRARQGIGRALVTELLGRGGSRPVVVATGRDNTPARALYEGLGFAVTGEREVLTGLWVTSYRRG
ncbi:GNAT family N-acetyltransferase [Blastococcus sp. SYSU D00820]